MTTTGGIERLKSTAYLLVDHGTSEKDVVRTTPPKVAHVAHYEPSAVSLSVGDAARAAAARAVQWGRADMKSNASAVKTFGNEAMAKAAFDAQKTCLADVNRWSSLSGAENASFALMGPDGQAVQRSAEVGDRIRIKLPGSPTFDWVQIETIEDAPDRFAITVRPTYDPTQQPLDKSTTAHFFTREATNTFSVEKQGNEVRARVLGMHESANVGSGSGGLRNAARNRAAAEVAWGIQRPIPGTTTTVNGLQQHQWNVFTSNLNDVH